MIRNAVCFFHLADLFRLASRQGQLIANPHAGSTSCSPSNYLVVVVLLDLQVFLIEKIARATVVEGDPVLAIACVVGHRRYLPDSSGEGKVSVKITVHAHYVLLGFDGQMGVRLLWVLP